MSRDFHNMLVPLVKEAMYVDKMSAIFMRVVSPAIQRAVVLEHHSNLGPHIAQYCVMEPGGDWR
eukprot:3510148-Prorocentrum_lima.AAC.1